MAGGPARNIVILPPAPREYSVADQNAFRSLVERALSTNYLVATHAATHYEGAVDELSHSYLADLDSDDHTQYHTDARALTWLGTRSTTDLPEGTNLYYTDARWQTAWGLKTTTDLPEGTNLYYTDARWQTAWGLKTTTDLPEGTNLYYTDERVDDRVDALIQDVAGKLTWTYDDGLGTLTPVITYDSQYFSGTNWTDLTDAGVTTLHTHTLDTIANPVADTTINMAAYTVEFQFTSPLANAIELTASGAFTGSLLHIHQHTGNPGACHLVEFEAEDSDVDFMEITGASSGNYWTDAQVSGDANYRFRARVDGALFWGDGTNSVDTNLYRSAANRLMTDDNLVVSLVLYLGSGLDTNLYRASANLLKTDDDFSIGGGTLYVGGNALTAANLLDLTDGGETALHIHDARYYTESEVDTIVGDYLPLAGGTMSGTISSNAVKVLYGGTAGSYIGLGPVDSGVGAGFGGTQHTDAAALNYRAYMAYDCYWDDSADQWTAMRTSLGRKWMLDMGYHNNSFRVRTFDGTVTSPWADSAWTNVFTVSSAGVGYFASTLTVNGASISIAPSGSRPVTLSNSSLYGPVSIKGVAGGWAYRYGTTGSADTEHGGFGIKGTNDAIDYWFIGPAYDDNQLRVYPTYTIIYDFLWIPDSDASVSSWSGSLRIGSSGSTQMLLDANEIMSKTDDTTAGTLYLQHEGGQLQVFGSIAGTMNVNGSITPLTDTTKNLGSTTYPYGIVYTKQVLRGKDAATDYLALGSDDDNSSGSNIILYGAGHPTVAYDIAIRNAAVNILYWDYSAGQLLIGRSDAVNAQYLRSSANTSLYWQEATTSRASIVYDTVNNDFEITALEAGSDVLLTPGAGGQVQVVGALDVTGALTVGSFSPTTLTLNSGVVLSNYDSGAGEDTLKILSATGYLLAGPRNASYCHFDTDIAGGFYFNKQITVDSGIITTYDEDLLLKRAGTLRATFGSALITFADDVLIQGYANITGSLIHDGTHVGFYGVTEVTRPSAYTQTYSTATRTHNNLTASNPTVVVTNTVCADYGTYNTNFNNIDTAINQLIADVTNVKQVLNQVIDDLQNNGLLQ